MTDSSRCALFNPARPLLLMGSLSIRRSAAATRSRARSKSATVYCGGSGRVRFLRGRFAALLPRMSWFAVATCRLPIQWRHLHRPQRPAGDRPSCGRLEDKPTSRGHPPNGANETLNVDGRFDLPQRSRFKFARTPLRHLPINGGSLRSAGFPPPYARRRAAFRELDICPSPVRR